MVSLGSLAFVLVSHSFEQCQIVIISAVQDGLEVWLELDDLSEAGEDVLSVVLLPLRMLDLLVDVKLRGQWIS